ncbi:MAG: GntR family transcriptional regulator [Bacillota bacterium]|nr:GntR family transcriptional regulator [Bacillota bacterium]
MVAYTILMEAKASQTNSNMINFENFKADGQSPIYQQILLYIKKGAVAGTIKDGDELPSRRNLSALLGINPNTVQKAFSQLEEEGLAISHSGAKSVMTLSSEKLAALRTELLTEDIKNLTSSMKQMNISKEEAIKLIEENWSL